MKNTFYILSQNSTKVNAIRKFYRFLSVACNLQNMEMHKIYILSSLTLGELYGRI